MFQDGRVPSALASGLTTQVIAAKAMSIVVLRGELDLAGERDFADAVERALAADPIVVAIDLRGVTFIDVRGIGALISVSERCQAFGRRLILVGSDPAVDRVLRLCGLEGRFEIVDGLDSQPSVR